MLFAGVAAPPDRGWRRPLGALLCALIAAACGQPAWASVVAAPPAAPPRLTVLFIAADDLRPELACYGAAQVKSPNLDRLARTGVLFERAYCQFPLCGPTRASLLSGTRPDSTKVHDLYSDFRAALPAIQSLPQWFKDQGYYTDRFGKIFHIDDVASWTPAYPPQKFGPAEPGKRAPYASAAINEAGWKKFDRAKAAGLVGMALERSQRGPAYEIADVDDDDLIDGQTALAMDDGVEFYTYTDVPATRPVPDEYARIARHGYYACVSYMDAQVGRVLDELERLGLSDSTIVVFWGDHGFKLGDHGGWGS